MPHADAGLSGPPASHACFAHVLLDESRERTDDVAEYDVRNKKPPRVWSAAAWLVAWPVKDMLQGITLVS